MKEKESKLAFICFHLFFGIKTFQSVMAKKNKKTFPFPGSRDRLWPRTIFKQRRLPRLASGRSVSSR
jgi:hypothetical protein